MKNQDIFPREKEAKRARIYILTSVLLHCHNQIRRKETQPKKHENRT